MEGQFVSYDRIGEVLARMRQEWQQLVGEGQALSDLPGVDLAAVLDDVEYQLTGKVSAWMCAPVLEVSSS